MNETKDLSRFISELRYEKLPKEVVEKAKGVVLNTLCVALASSTLPWSKAAYKYVKGVGGVPESTMVAYGDKTSAANAAFFNGVCSHGFEFDDTSRRSAAHTGCAVVPTALAMGEKELVDGKTFILAVVAGCEATVRIGASVYPSAIRRGHHATSTFGCFGAAAASGIVLGFDPEKMLNAIAIASTGMGGVMVDRKSGVGITMKRFLGGVAAAAGIRAALLAQLGISGQPNILENEPFGVCHAVGDNYDISQITRDLGTDFAVMDLYYKPYASSSFLPPMYRAVTAIVEKHPVNTKDISEIRVGTFKDVIGKETYIIEPADISAAHFSAAFGVALRLVKGGNGFREYTDENLKDPEILRLARMVKVYEEEAITKAFPIKEGARVTIKLKDGTSYESKIDDVPVLTIKEVQAKFRDVATLVIDKAKAENIIDMVMEVEKVRDISVLAGLLVR